MLDLPKFYTFAVSHYSEKARWAMDHCEVAYDEHPLTPSLHYLTVLKHSDKKRTTTVPLLVDGDNVVQNSSAIMRWAHDQKPEKGLFGTPAKPGKNGKVSQTAEAKAEKQRAGIEAVIKQFARVGGDVRTVGYWHLMQNRQQMLMLLTWASSPLQTLALRAAFPAVKVGLTKAYGLTAEATEQAHQRLEEQLDAIVKATAKTGYLCGNDITAADIAVASLLAPIAMPEEHPVYRAIRKNPPAAIATLSEHAGMQWVRDVFSKHRYAGVV